MHRVNVSRSALAALLALGVGALAPGIAQARLAARAPGASRAEVHAGVKVYEYCTTTSKCWTAMFLYPKSNEFEVPEASIPGGKITIKKEKGKPKESIFTSVVVEGNQCVITATKTSTGYSSEAAPGKIVCGEAGQTPYIEEGWWAIKV